VEQPHDHDGETGDTHSVHEPSPLPRLAHQAAHAAPHQEAEHDDRQGQRRVAQEEDELLRQRHLDEHETQAEETEVAEGDPMGER